MNWYKALNGHGHSITIVLAEDEDQARERIRVQLDRPGAQSFFEQWQKAGKPVIQIEDDLEAVVTDLIGTLNLAARKIAEVDPAKLWSGWITYILKELQNRTSEDSYRAFLVGLQSDIAVYLEHGQWLTPMAEELEEEP